MKLDAWDPDLLSLVSQIRSGDIDLQPDFQRQEVWPTAKKKRLIDTILRSWSIPPVHFVVVNDNRLVVLDGQQRLAAIRDFFDNKLTIDGNITPTDSRLSILDGLRYEKLSQSDRRMINFYPLRCFKIWDYKPDEPNELFYRLNQPTMLTAGEQRNALFGPAREQLKYLVSYFEDLDNTKSTLGFSNARLAYDDVFARLLYFLEVGSFGEKGTELKISERFRTGTPFSEHIVKKCESTIEIFSDQRKRTDNYKLNKASLLSWLLFFSRFCNWNLDKYFMFVFAQESENAANSVFSQPISLFEDRSSLRVTDVSSVVFRDFALCFVYFFGTGSILPPGTDLSSLIDVRNFFDTQQENSFERALSENLDISRWSRSL